MKFPNPTRKQIESDGFKLWHYQALLLVGIATNLFAAQHLVVGFFNLIICLPLVWLLLKTITL